MKVSVPTIDGVPVLLPAHDHPEFGDPGRHYHIDFRYCPDSPVQSRVIFSEAEPVYADREPVRPDGYLVRSQAIGLALDLAVRFRDKESVCGKCPHKGLPVYEGVCTGHGLTFDAAGRVIHAREFNLRLGSAVLPVIPGCRVYCFVMPERQLLSCMELVAPDGRVVARAPFTGDAIVSVAKGDLVSLTIP